MAVNVKNLYGNSGKRFKLINTRYRMFNKIQLTVFTLLVFVCGVFIFPIHCDLSDFLQKTMQQTKTSKVNTVSCILLKILASIYRFESFTWIPIQILYIHSHFKLCNMKLHVLMIKLTHWAWAACACIVILE